MRGVRAEPTRIVTSNGVELPENAQEPLDVLGGPQVYNVEESQVLIGTPCRTAAAIPTTMTSTPSSARRMRIS